MIEHLAVFGDSWPNGAELKDRTQAFGYLLANRLNASYHHHAISASSNDRTILQLRQYIKNQTTVAGHTAVFFLTSVSRRLFLNNNGIRELKIPSNLRDESDPFVKSWYMYFQSEESDQFNLYKNLLSLQRICDQYQIRDYYISGWTDLDFEMPGVDTKKIYPTSCVKLFDGKNTEEFHDFEQNQYIYPNRSHPNIAGHALIADHLYKWITNV
jgi:hypothetical protein